MDINLNMQDLFTIISALKNAAVYALANNETEDCMMYLKLCRRLENETGIKDFES